MARMDRSIAPTGTMPFNGCTKGPQRLARANFTDISYHLYPVNLGGWNNPIGRAYLASNVVRPEVLLKLAPRTGVSSREELQHLLAEMRRELQQIGFCGVGMIVSSFGRKAAAHERPDPRHS